MSDISYLRMLGFIVLVSFFWHGGAYLWDKVINLKLPRRKRKPKDDSREEDRGEA